MRRIKLVIFDLDGTLVDAYAAVARSVNHTMKQLGLPGVSSGMIKRAVGWGERNLLKRFVPSVDLEQALVIYRRHHHATLRRGVEFLPGARRTLGTLKKEGFWLAIASNRSTASTLKILRCLGVRKDFQYILCADKLKFLKPHPQILQKILRHFALKPNEVLYVGDMALDVETGRRAGIKTVAVTGGSSKRKELAGLKPWRILRGVAPVAGIVEDLNRSTGAH